MPIVLQAGLWGLLSSSGLVIGAANASSSRRSPSTAAADWPSLWVLFSTAFQSLW